MDDGRAAGARVRVLYIAGAGRSGSTLLECMLGQIPGIVAAGEVTHLFRRGWVENQLCGCGEPFHGCGFWPGVIETAFPDAATSPAERADARDCVCRLSRLPQLAVPGLRTPAFERRLAAHADGLLRLYRAIRERSGAAVVVDSSKYPPEAWLLSRMEGIDLHVVHLVRDSASVVASWRRRKVRPEIHWKRELMPRYPAVQTALAWTVFNRLLERLGRRAGVGYQRVRFEELVARPREVLAEIARRVGRDGAELGFVGDGHVRLDPTHTVSGNPSRFRTGRVPLESGLAVPPRLPWGLAAAVTALTFPQRIQYGYPALAGRGPGRRDGARARTRRTRFDARLTGSGHPAGRRPRPPDGRSPPARGEPVICTPCGEMRDGGASAGAPGSA